MEGKLAIMERTHDRSKMYEDQLMVSVGMERDYLTTTASLHLDSQPKLRSIAELAALQKRMRNKGRDCSRQTRKAKIGIVERVFSVSRNSMGSTKTKK
jgi:hypothetical protein